MNKRSKNVGLAIKRLLEKEVSGFAQLAQTVLGLLLLVS